MEDFLAIKSERPGALTHLFEWSQVASLLIQCHHHGTGSSHLHTMAVSTGHFQDTGHCQWEQWVGFEGGSEGAPSQQSRLHIRASEWCKRPRAVSLLTHLTWTTLLCWLVLLFLCFPNSTQVGVIWEKETAIEKLLQSDLWGIFLIVTMWKGPAHCGQSHSWAGSPGLYQRGSAGSHGEQASDANSSVVSTSVPNSCPSFPW